MWKIYKHTFPNGKIYIGQTKQSLARRFHQGNGYIGCPLVKKAIDKYGWNNVITEIIQDNIPTLDKANELEKYYIELYNSRNPEIGYNIGIGGGVIEQCNDTRIIDLWNDGKSITQIVNELHYDPQTIRQYLDRNGITKEDRAARKSEILSQTATQYNYQLIYQLWQRGLNYQQIRNELHCSKHPIHDALNYYNVPTIEREARGQELAIINKTDRKQVAQYDLEGNYIQTFNSIADANRSLGKPSNSSNISAVCKGNRKQAYGYKWQYIK